MALIPRTLRRARRATVGPHRTTLVSLAVPLWLVWLAAGSAGILAYLTLERSPVSAAVYGALAFSSAGVVVLGIVRARPRPSRPWWLLAAGIGLIGVGDVIFNALEAVGGVGVPSLADVLYISGWVALCLSASLLLLRRSRPLTGLLDAFVIASAFAITLWALVVSPRIDAVALPLPALVTVIAYPAMDVAMLSILLVAVLAGRPLDRATSLFAEAAFAFLVSDLAYATVASAGGYHPGLVDAGWLLGFVLWGAAALALGVVEREPVARHGERPIWPLLRPWVLLAAIVTPFCVAVAQEVWMGGADALAAAATSVLVSLVVIARLEIAVRHQARLLDDRRRLEATLLRQATEDPLTELPNRRGLAERVVAALAKDDAAVALLVLDLDDFKAVNDALGHQAGDALLRAVAIRLRAAVRRGDTVARFGGDEFAVVLDPCPSVDIATGMADRILRSFEDPVVTDRGEVAVSSSIGIALSDGVAPSSESLLRDADLALYRAKAAGKHRWAMLDAETSAAALRTLSIASELARAVEAGEFELRYQPIVTLADGTVESFEALVRWNHPTLGTLAPSEFLASAERSVHMPAIGRWIIEEACDAAAAWRALGFQDVGVNVNVSAAQLADDQFPEIVLGALRRAGLPPQRLTLEILEGALDATAAMGERLGRLRDAGVRLAIDDFGTGYSALSRVAEIPVTELKLDRSLLAGMEDARMVGAIVRLGQTLGLRLVAEGVETSAELERVKLLGCHAAQGYRIGRPVSANEVAPLLRSWPVPGSAPRRVAAAAEA